MIRYVSLLFCLHLSVFAHALNKEDRLSGADFNLLAKSVDVFPCGGDQHAWKANQAIGDGYFKFVTNNQREARFFTSTNIWGLLGLGATVGFFTGFGLGVANTCSHDGLWFPAALSFGFAGAWAGCFCAAPAIFCLPILDWVF